jgi:hypothetical protein
MAALGSLVVKLALEYAQFTAGVKKSEQDALAFAKRVQDGMDKAGRATSDFLGGVVTGALAAVASYQTVATVIGNVRSAIDRLDALNDLSERLGVSAKALQEIGYAGVYADASLESIGKGLQKLSQNMVEANDASSKQAALFRALGVATTDAEGNLRDSADVMTDLAGYFEGVEDGAVKTALAIKLFGKQGVDLIPLLNGGKEGLEKARIEAEKFGVVVGEDAVKAAAAFNDNMDRLGKITEGTYNQISSAVLPVLVAFSDAMVQAASDTQSVNSAAQELSKNGTIFEWAKSGAIGITYLMDAAEGVTRVLKALGQVAGGYFAAVGEIISGTTGAIKRALSGDLSGAVSEIEGIKRRSRVIGEEITASLGNTFGDRLLGNKIRDRLQDLKQFGNAAAEVGTKAKPTKAVIDALADSADKAGKAADENAAALQKWTDQIQKYNVELDAQAEQTDKLSKAEQWLAELTANSTSEVQKLTDEQREALTVELQLTIAKEKRNKALEDEAKWLKESAAENAKAADSVRQQTEKYADELVALQKRGQAIGLTAEQVAALEAAELRELATQKERQAVLFEDIDLTGATSEQYRRQAAALRDIANQKQKNASDEAFLEAQRKEAEELQRLNDQIGQGFANSMIEGGRSWFEYMKSLLRAQVFAPLFKNMVAPLSGALSGVLSGFTGALSGSGSILGGAGGAGGGGVDIGSLFSKITDGFSGSIGNAFAQFSASGLGAQLGLSNPIADLTGTIANIPTSLSNSLGSILGGLGNGFAGYGLSKSLSGGYSVGGGNTLNAIGGVASMIPAIGPIAGAITGAINRLFGRKLADSGIEGTFGGAAGFEGSSTQFFKGGLFRSDKTTKTALGSDFTDPLAQGVNAVRDQVKAYAAALNIPVDALESYTQTIKFSTKDLKPEQIQAELEKALGAFTDGLADTLAGSVDPFKAAGETTTQTLQRLGESLNGVNPIIESLGLSLFDVSAAGGDAASKLVTLFGGLDGLASSAATFYGAFYSEAERAGKATEAVTKALADVGVAMPATKEEFRALVEAQDLTTESGREAFAALLQVSGAFSDLQAGAEETAIAATEAAEALSKELSSAIASTADKFRNPEQRTANAYAGISASLGAVGVDVSVEQLIGASKEQVGEFFAAFVASAENTDEAKLAVTEAASALADLKDEAVDAAAEVARAAAELHESVAQALDGVVADFLSGTDLAQYRAQRIADRLGAAGIESTAGGVLGSTQQDIVDLWNSVGDESRLVIADLYDDWVALQTGIQQSAIDDFLTGLGVSADELASAYAEINPAAESLVDTWRRTRGEVDDLAAALAEIDGTGAVSAVDKLRATITQRDALQGVISGNADRAFDLRVGQGGTQAVDLLKKREAELWRQFASSGNPEVAKAITETTLQRIALEGEVQAQADQAKIDALNEQISAAERLKDIAAGMGQFVLSLKAGSLSNLSYGGRLDAQRQLFDTAITTGGDVQGQAQAYLQQAQQVYGGSTAEYAAIFEQVTGQLEALGLTGGTQADSQIATAQAQLEALNASNDISSRQIDALDSLNGQFGSQLDTLNVSVADQRAVLGEQLAVQTKQLEALELQITQNGEAYTKMIEQLSLVTTSFTKSTRADEMAAAGA